MFVPHSLSSTFSFHTLEGGDSAQRCLGNSGQEFFLPNPPRSSPALSSCLVKGVVGHDCPCSCVPPSLMPPAGIWGDLLTALHESLLQMPTPACTAELQHPHPAFCILYYFISVLSCFLYSHEGQDKGIRAHGHPANTVLHSQNINLGAGGC